MWSTARRKTAQHTWVWTVSTRTKHEERSGKNVTTSSFKMLAERKRRERNKSWGDRKRYIMYMHQNVQFVLADSQPGSILSRDYREAFVATNMSGHVGTYSTSFLPGFHRTWNGLRYGLFFCPPPTFKMLKNVLHWQSSVCMRFKNKAELWIRLAWILKMTCCDCQGEGLTTA